MRDLTSKVPETNWPDTVMPRKAMDRMHVMTMEMLVAKHFT